MIINDLIDLENGVKFPEKLTDAFIFWGFFMKTSHQSSPQRDLFREHLNQMINPAHPLVRMAKLIDWEQAEAITSHWFSDTTGRQAKSGRLIVGLFLLKQMKNVSDEELPALWVENPYWQYFCGEEYFQHEFPIHPTSMSKWRKKMTETDAEALLSLTITLALSSKTIKRSDMKRVNADTTVQEKAVEYPTDTRLCTKAIIQLGKLSKQHGVKLKQNYKFTAKKLHFKINNYHRAQQFKRAKKAQAKLKTCLGRLSRDITRQLEKQPKLTPVFQEFMKKTERLLTQSRTSKNKLYSLHAPEVECIAKGKLKKRYEFGVKASAIATQKNNFILGASALHGSPYDGHTLKPALDQVERLSGVRPKRCFVDNGYKGHAEEQTDIHIARKKRTYATRYLKRLMKQRNAIEALFGHAKRDTHLGRNYLKGQHGDKLNVLLSAVGYNLRMILRIIWLFLCCYLSGALMKIRRWVQKMIINVDNSQPKWFRSNQKTVFQG